MDTSGQRGHLRQPEPPAAGLARMIERTRRAQRWWDRVGFAARRRFLRRWASTLTRLAPRLAETMRAETGKPIPVGITEIAIAVDHLVWAANNARRVLGERRVPGSLLQPEYAARVSYRPCGVVGIIGPADFPVFSPLGAMGLALAAGNAVILKPSEYAPRLGRVLIDSLTRVVSAPVARLLPGDGAAGAALCEANVDMIAFTGSPEVARRVMAACAASMTPVVLESGGEDAMIVAGDADVDAAAEAACFGAFFNSGQTCVGIQRVYVAAEVYDAFLARLARRARGLSVGYGRYADLGPILRPERVDLVRRHIADAVERGASVITGGLGAIDPPFVAPTIVVNVPVDARVMREETPGPVLAVTRTDTAAEALALANSAAYGLGGSVFGGRDAEALARGMRSGMTSVNSVLAFATLPACPFGGAGGTSGFGRVHGDDGLRAFTQTKAIASRRFRSPIRALTFDRDPRAVTAQVLRAIRIRHGNYR
ncbi:MAG TPA: aldehyde dehydrogenase family protein [Stackebrandtia sp.]|jgi:acyl-CoA reductase-like NAD-dependent aldehyde dehydrogenase|nr:aldehyde dehydrogenase family protein [Stackebrandtia sp.]